MLGVPDFRKVKILPAVYLIQDLNPRKKKKKVNASLPRSFVNRKQQTPPLYSFSDP